MGQNVIALSILLGEFSHITEISKTDSKQSFKGKLQLSQEAEDYFVCNRMPDSTLI